MTSIGEWLGSGLNVKRRLITVRESEAPFLSLPASGLLPETCTETKKPSAQFSGRRSGASILPNCSKYRDIWPVEEKVNL